MRVLKVLIHNNEPHKMGNCEYYLMLAIVTVKDDENPDFYRIIEDNSKYKDHLILKDNCFEVKSSLSVNTKNSLLGMRMHQIVFNTAKRAICERLADNVPSDFTEAALQIVGALNERTE